MFAAFVQGRHTGNLFLQDFTGLLDMSLTDVQSVLGLDHTYDWRWRDLALFLMTVAALCPVAALVTGTISIVTSPAWIAEGAYRQRRSTDTGPK